MGQRPPKRPRPRPATGDVEPNYPVGYGRPPKNTQFQPGRSGNPKGRSPRSRNFKTMVDKVVGERVEIRESGRILRMSKIEALFRTVMSRAFKGDPKAMASFIAILKYSGYGADAAESGPELLHGIDHQAVLKEFLTRTPLHDSEEFGASPLDSTELLDTSKGRRR